jgi:hypothetical protein
MQGLVCLLSFAVFLPLCISTIFSRTSVLPFYRFGGRRVASIAMRSGICLEVFSARNPLFAHLTIGLMSLPVSLPVEMQAILDVKTD